MGMYCSIINFIFNSSQKRGDFQKTMRDVGCEGTEFRLCISYDAIELKLALFVLAFEKKFL